jgi:predicted ATPase
MKKYVITGGPGFGKTTLINALRGPSIWGGRELYDDFILEQLKIGGDSLPWINRDKFERAILPLKINEYLTAPTDMAVQLFDRGFPDHLGYCRNSDMKPLQEWQQAIATYRYDGVFIVPPWREIYEQDEVRREPWEQALALHESIVTGYRESGYDPIITPITSVQSRVQFILNAINMAGRHH